MIKNNNLNNNFKDIKMKCFLCDYKGNMQIKSSVEGRDIVKCPKCELEFIYNQPSFEEIKNIYSSDYYKAWGMESGENTEVASMKKKHFCRYA